MEAEDKKTVAETSVAPVENKPEMEVKVVAETTPRDDIPVVDAVKKPEPKKTIAAEISPVVEETPVVRVIPPPASLHGLRPPLAPVKPQGPLRAERGSALRPPLASRRSASPAASAGKEKTPHRPSSNPFEWFPPAAVPLMAAGTLLALMIGWFALADIHYRAGSTWFPFATAGWFWLTAILIAALGAAIGRAFAFGSRIFGEQSAWLALLLVSAVLFSIAFYLRSPSRVMQRLIGEEAFNKATIQELHVTDSFRKGDFYCGIINGSPEVLAAISKRMKLHPETLPAPNLRQVFPQFMFPEDLYAYTDPGCIFYLHPTLQKIFFLYRSKAPARHRVDLTLPPEPEIRIPAKIPRLYSEPEISQPGPQPRKDQKYTPPGSDDAEE